MVKKSIQISIEEYDSMAGLTTADNELMAKAEAFYEKLLANGKAKLQAITAVMRKLLHALWGMLHHRQVYVVRAFGTT